MHTHTHTHTHTQNTQWVCDAEHDSTFCHDFEMFIFSYSSTGIHSDMSQMSNEQNLLGDVAHPQRASAKVGKSNENDRTTSQTPSWIA